MKKLISFLLLLLGPQQLNASDLAEAPSAPPNTCSARFGEWCVLQDVSAKFVDRNQERDVIEFSPANPHPYQQSVVVLAEHGCLEGFSSEMTYTGFELDRSYAGGTKDALIVKLSRSCTLRILLPRWSGDSLDWPYRTGLSLIRPCPDEQCRGPSIGDLRSKFEIKYRRQIIRP